METFAGKWFPLLRGGKGAMLLITDGGPGGTLTPFISNGSITSSKAANHGHFSSSSAGAGDGGSMTSFIPTVPATLEAHPPIGPQDSNPGASHGPLHGEGKGDRRYILY